MTAAGERAIQAESRDKWPWLSETPARRGGCPNSLGNAAGPFGERDN